MKKLLLCTTAAFLLGTANMGTFAQSGKHLEVNNNQYMRVAHHDDFNIAADQDFTMSLWVKMDDVTAGSNKRFVAKRDLKVTAAGDGRTGYEYWGGNSTSASGWAALNTPTATSGNVLSKWSTSGGKVGEWFHLALIVDRVNNKITFYHNGINVASSNVGTWTCLNKHDLYVGCGLSGGEVVYPLTGAIDNLRFYRKALTASELSTEMGTNKLEELPADLKSTLRAAYDFEETANLLIPDISGNDHNGSMRHVIPPSEGGVRIFSDDIKQETWLTGRGNENEVLIQGKFVASGQDATTFQSTTIDLQGTTNLEDIKAIKVYSTGSENKFDERDPKAQLLGTITSLSSGKIEIPLSGDISTGAHYLWITAHIADQATEGNHIDIQWNKITLSSGEYHISKSNPEGNCGIVLRKKLLYAPGDHGSKSYRIPAIIRAADGSLVIATDKRKANQTDLPEDIDVLINRSTDGGDTWSEPLTIAKGTGRNKGYGDAALVKCTNGELVAIFVGGPGLFPSTPSNPIRTYICKSNDNGITWTAPRDITPQLFGSECQDAVRSKWHGSFCASGVGLCTSQGRIMFVAAVRYDSGRILYNHVYYSDDNGDTWKVSDSAKTGGDEAKVVELNDGTILMSIRRQGGGARYYNTSKDQGVTWGTDNLSYPDLIEPNCNGDIIRFSSTKTGADNDRILHTVPNHANTRKNVSMLVSYDEARTWTAKKTIYPFESVYSSATVLPDETIGVYLEENLGNRLVSMYYVNFSLNWLTDGKDPHTGVKTYNVTMDYKTEEGKVSGEGVFATNSQITLTAKPADGFKFAKWTTQEGEDVSTLNPYEFTLTENKEFKAVFSPTTGMVSTSGKTSISAYPNPFVETIEIDGVTAGDHITVYNLLGSVVAQSVATGSKTSLKLSSLIDGRYIIQVTQSDSVQSIQVIKYGKQ